MAGKGGDSDENLEDTRTHTVDDNDEGQPLLRGPGQELGLCD